MCYRYNGKVHPHLPKVSALLLGLLKNVGIEPKVIVVHSDRNPEDPPQWQSGWTSWKEFLQVGAEKKLGRKPDGEIEWKRLGFNWPLWILFSSGTTGAILCTMLRQP